MSNSNLLVELFVEELPPKALNKLGQSFAAVLAAQLQAQGLAGAGAVVTAYASPRRLAAHITQVAVRAADRAVSQKLMPVSVGLEASGAATPALLKRLAALGADASAVPALKRAPDGKTEALFLDSVQPGVTLVVGLQKALEEAIAKLPIPKVMSYQLESGCALPGWTSVNFVRPAHGLLALHGATVVPIQALGLVAGNVTHGHRFEATVDPIVITHADAYADLLVQQGAVIASFAQRRAEIVQQLAAAAAQVGAGSLPAADEALLDEVTALVERPKVLLCQFDTQFLEVPQECLILTMKANQKYFPLLDAQGKLTHQFLVVSNINPADASAVVQGNERVVRPRLADAKFFFDQDRKKSLESRVEGLSKVVYHNQLGSQGQRAQRVAAIAAGVVALLVRGGLAEATPAAFSAQVTTAARLAKTDLLTDMVGEFPELQGIMGAYYARHDGLPEDVAQAIEDHYKPRFAGDELPRGTVGLVVALADKLETLVGLFGIGALPTGDKDPFALRRHALGVIRMLTERALPLQRDELVDMAAATFDFAATWSSIGRAALLAFIDERLAGALREQGWRAQEVDAVLALRPQRLADVTARLAAVRAFADLPEAPALAAANKRIGKILKKAEESAGTLNRALLLEPAELALAQALDDVLARAQDQFDALDLTGHLRTLAALRAPVDGFFNDVMVNADDAALRANRLALLHSLQQAMNRVAELARLAV
ncbi:MAG: glycine--tRNA ligase subunit beta [Rhodoferax sp.]|nr:glycine--tRNA ligase subunit beta [Rhodoferax sp.]